MQNAGINGVQAWHISHTTSLRPISFGRELQWCVAVRLVHHFAEGYDVRCMFYPVKVSRQRRGAFRPISRNMYSVRVIYRLCIMDSSYLRLQGILENSRSPATQGKVFVKFDMIDIYTE